MLSNRSFLSGAEQYVSHPGTTVCFAIDLPKGILVTSKFGRLWIKHKNFHLHWVNTRKCDCLIMGVCFRNQTCLETPKVSVAFCIPTSSNRNILFHTCTWISCCQCLGIWPFKKNIFLSRRQIYRERQRERGGVWSSICWLTPLMATMDGAEPKRSTSSRCAQAQGLSHPSLFSWMGSGAEGTIWHPQTEAWLSMPLRQALGLDYSKRCAVTSHWLGLCFSSDIGCSDAYWPSVSLQWSIHSNQGPFLIGHLSSCCIVVVL